MILNNDKRKPEDLEQAEQRIVRAMLERGAILMKAIGYPFYVKTLLTLAIACLITCYGATSSLTLNSVYTNAGDSATVVMPLVLTNPAGVGQPAGVQFTLVYAATDIANISVAPGPAATAASKSNSCAGGGGRYMCLQTGINTNTIASGVLVYVTVSLAHRVTKTSISVSGTLGATLGGDAFTITGTGGSIVLVNGKGIRQTGVKR